MVVQAKVLMLNDSTILLTESAILTFVAGKYVVSSSHALKLFVRRTAVKIGQPT
jgi:hypothetical protein